MRSLKATFRDLHKSGNAGTSLQGTLSANYSIASLGFDSLTRGKTVTVSTHGQPSDSAFATALSSLPGNLRGVVEVDLDVLVGTAISATANFQMYAGPLDANGAGAGTINAF